MPKLMTSLLAASIMAATLTLAAAVPATAATNDDPAVGQGSSLAAIQRAPPSPLTGASLH